MKMIITSIISVVAFGAFEVKADRPAFPTRNIDTRTIKKIGGKFRTPTSHLPVMKMSLDGRIGLALHRKNSYRFHIVRPESVKNHVKSSANNSVGANMMATPRYYTGLYNQLNNRFKSSVSDWKDYDAGYEAFFCEKNDIRPFPFVCETKEHDCYRLTLISPYLSKDHLSEKKTRMTSIDLIVMVKNPKTKNAYIDKIFPIKGSEKVGPKLGFRFSAEHNVVGDQRLFVFRVGGKSTKRLNPEGIGAVRNNIVYSTYPKWKKGRKTMQCDVNAWKNFYPITHAYYDKKNAMKARYKFARYPLRDSFGHVYGSNEELGGSYPWMDEDAANLFFTATGVDRYYNEINGVIKGLFPEPRSNYVMPDDVSQSIIDKTGLDRIGTIEKRDRTTGVSYAGFWSHGKTVLLDGLLNNTDYNFQVSTPGINDLTRKLKLYQGTPKGQYYEPTGLTRERGANAEYHLYSPNMVINSTFMNSMTNRFNFFNKMKPGVPRDVTWHFSSARFGEELVFDDFMSPYLVINAEMNAAVGKPENRYNFSMVSYDGHKNGRAVNDSNLYKFPYRPKYHALAFQNASTAPSSFMKVPSFGRPIGDVRVEAIAKGGIYGKGAWLSGNAGIQFKIPKQDTSKKNRFRIDSNKNFYVGLFIDSRWNGSVNKWTRRTIMSLNGNKKIVLTKGGTHSSQSHVRFDRIQLMQKNKVLATRYLNGATKIYNEKSVHKGWRHVGIQFTANGLPVVFIDGFQLGQFTPSKNVSASKVKSFFRLWNGQKITLGSDKSRGNSGLRGWVDDFKVIARNITNHEERCNIARGTLVKINSKSAGYWKWRSQQYPNYAHKSIASAAGHNSKSRYVCYFDYGNYGSKKLTSTESYASLHTLPRNTHSVRDQLVNQKKHLHYNRPRPGQAKNNFCLSCHVPNSQNPNKELNIDALKWKSGVKAIYDSRRQPSQPAAVISGIIPAHYFGTGKPARKLNNPRIHNHKLDKWILR